jgi:uncharacterized membrane protein affecting hemolysin expression
LEFFKRPCGGGIVMPMFQDLSIRHKLQGIVAFVCGMALFVASATFTFYDRTTFLCAKTDDLMASAKMIGSNSTAALIFHDSKSAREILNALHAKLHVIHACIYDSEGKVFATYSRDTSAAGFSPPAVQKDGSRVGTNNMVLFQDIIFNGDSIGSIYIEADLRDLHDRLLRFVLIEFVVLLASLAIAVLLSYRLQRVISGPIQELAETASSVTAHENYSARAVKRGQEEIGVLFDRFNSMLDRIQQRDVDLQKAHQDLERRVEERTSYLNALIENSPLANFWSIEFPPASELEQQASSVWLECSSCKRHEKAVHTDMEADVYAINDGLVRYCKKCGSSTHVEASYR